MNAICPYCREPAGAATDRFCEVCGAQLRGPLDPVADRVEVDLGGFAGVSDRGHVHARNEDAMALGRRPEEGPAHILAAVVCDGVSTVRQPELASRTATAVALGALLADPAADAPRMPVAIAAAAEAVAQLAPGTPDAPSCTLVAALITGPADAAPAITVGWVGDSRAYWLAEDGAARLLTTDHSWAAEMVGAGILDAATAMRDPRAHAITRWLGADGEPVPGVTTFSPADPGVLLLCTDGLWNYEPDAARLAALALPVIAREGPRAAAVALTAFALAAGGRDNITAVCIPVPPSSARPDTEGSAP
jgi:serine/threonine protein phosphatase PrpC